MLDTIRKMAKGWVATILIGLLVMSFALWGVADVFTGYGANSVASVGDKDIGYRAFQRAFQGEMRTINQRLGTPLTNQQAVAFGVPNRVLGRLTTEATVEEIAEDLELGISETRLSTVIQTDPSLRGAGGTFDRASLQYVLSQTGMSENEFVIGRKNSVLREQLADGLVGEMTVPSTYMEAFNAFQNEQRAVDYGVLAATDLPAITEPTDTDLRAFFDADKAAFKAPEFRSFDLLVIDPTIVANVDDVSDEDAKKEYEEAKNSRYGAPERRDFQQLIFPDAASAKAASTKMEGGTSFEDIVIAEKKDLADIQFGLKGKGEIIDKAISEAVFSLPLNGVSKVVEGRFGNFILRVTDIREAAALPYEEVKDQIKRDVASQNAQSEVFRLYDEVEDARAGGTTLKEISDRFGIPLRTITKVDNTGKADDGSQADLPQQGSVLADAFRTEIGDEADVVQIGQQGFAWFEVTDIVAATDRTFEDARSRVTDAWRADRLKNQLDDKAKEIVAAVKTGKSLLDQFTPLGIEVQQSEEISRAAQPEGLPAPLATAVFDGPDGYVSSINGADADTRIIFAVTSASEPAYFEEAQGNAETREQFETALQQTVLLQYVQKVQSDLGVTVNNQAIGYILGLNGEGQGQRHQGM